MSEIEILENIATKAVHRLRTETLVSGEPFMINIKGLPNNQCYLEFPDHSIQLVNFVQGKSDFVTLRTLSSAEGERLRRSIGL